jgi:hypothetical protein
MPDGSIDGPATVEAFASSDPWTSKKTLHAGEGKMFFKRLTVALLGAALLVAATSAVGPASGAETGKRLARGKTGQKRGVAVRVYPRAIKFVGFNAVLRCRDGSRLVVEEGGFLKTPVGGNGKFNDKQYGNTDTVRMRGRVGKKFVNGRIRVQDRWGKTRCDSKWFKFSARIKG